MSEFYRKNILIFSSIILLVIIVVIILVLSLRKKESKSDKESDKESDKIACLHDIGMKAAKNFFSKNIGSVIMSNEEFKNIVVSVNGNTDLALLSIANAISYSGITTDGQPILRFGPSPSAAHNVISGYPVGACVLGKSGKVYFGANFEFFAPLSNTIHGEQCAIHNAAVNKEVSILKLAVNAAPCGHCRQYLVEIGNPTELDVIFCNNDGNFVSEKLSNLLPNNFGPMNLGMTENVFNHHVITGGETVGTDTTSNGAKKAIEMCKQSYAVYSSRHVGVALQFSDSSIVGGQDLENAAYNPTVTAIRGAFSLAALMGKDLSTLTQVHVCIVSLGDHVCPPKENAPVTGATSSHLEAWYSTCVDPENEIISLVNSIKSNITINNIILTPSPNDKIKLKSRKTYAKILRLPL